MENLFAVSCCKPFLEKIYYFTYFLLTLLLLSSFVKLGKGFLFMSEKNQILYDNRPCWVAFGPLRNSIFSFCFHFTCSF